ncbi:MAG: twin-arginine translocase TatA/TatE family subunit [Planctomycetota bacterium]
MLGFLGLPSGSEWFVILIIILIFFGATRLPALAKGLGKSVREFKKGIKEEDDESKDSSDKSVKTEDPTTDKIGIGKKE